MQKVAVVGYGFMGQMHSTAYSALPNAQLKAVVDIDPKKRKKAEADHGVKTVEKVDGVLSDDSIDMIDVCLPTYLHKEYTIAALEAKKHVLCEKPMARRPEECHEMIKAAQTAGCHLMVAQCLRFWPEYAKAKELIDGGSLGAIESIVCRRVSPRPTWSWENWLQKPELSGAALLDLHVHDIDFIVHLLGKPRAVTARGIKRDTGWDHVFATYQYDGGPVAFAEGAWDYGKTFPFSMSFCIGLQGGAICYDLSKQPTFCVARNDSDKLEHPELLKIEARQTAAGGNISDLGGYFLEIEYFVNCLEQGLAPSRVPLSETALDIDIAFAEADSAERGVTVEL